MSQRVRMVITGEFKNPDESREAINLFMRYSRNHGLRIESVNDVAVVDFKNTGTGNTDDQNTTEVENVASN